MEELKQWAGVLCCTAVFISAVEIIAPCGSYKKIVKLALAAVTAAVIISPLFSLKDFGSSIKLELNDISAKSESIENSIAQQTEKLIVAAVSSNITSIAEAENIEVIKIDTVTNIDKDSGISIEQITVIVGKEIEEQRIEAFTKIVFDKLGLKAEVKKEGG